MLEKLDRYIEILLRITLVIAMPIVCFVLIVIGVFTAHEFITIMRLLYQ
jgi:hypothetical protein